jgi:hypothetical protein
MTTPRGNPELVEGQAIPETTVNEQIRGVEAGASHYRVVDRVTAPPGSPTDGDVYLIIATATGAFAGKENQFAIRFSTSWIYRTPIEGTTAWVMDENEEYRFDGSAWAVPTVNVANITTDVSSQSGTSYTAVLGDANSVIEFSNAGAITFTIPTNASVAFPVGTFIEIHQTGGGAVTPTPDTGVTLQVRTGFSETAGQYAVAAIRKVATNTWRLTGDLT